MTSLTSFALFSQLAPEIRDKIWTLALPPARIIQVLSSVDLPGGSGDTGYTTLPSSYGAQHPAILSVSRESRAQALRHLTLRFDAYWNLKIDTPYVEVKRWGEVDAMRQLRDMRTNNLLAGFSRLALDSDIWRASRPEHCMTSLRLLPNIATCAFVFRARRWHTDVAGPGVAWSLLPLNGTEQREFDWRETAPRLIGDFELGLERYQAEQSLKDIHELQERPSGFEITMVVIGERTMIPKPFSSRYYERPGQDFFG